MPKLIYVGPNRENKRGISSKAYTVRRIDCDVLTRYGSVQSIGGGGGRLHWVGSGPVERRLHYRSKAAAKRAIAKIISRRFTHGYEKLPATVRIYPPIRGD
jgi:hypothetical protein